MTAWARMPERTRRSSVRSGVEAGLADHDIADLLGAPVREVRRIITEAVGEAAAATAPEATMPEAPPRTLAVHRPPWSEWPEARIEELKRLLAEHLRPTEIAKRMGLTRGQLAGKMDRLGLGAPGRPARAPQDRRTAAPRPRPPRQPTPKTPVKPRPPTDPERVVPQRTDVPEPLSRHVRLVDLAPADCRWPSGNAPGDMTFCGAGHFLATGTDAAPSPYCEHHTARAYPPRGVRDRLDRRLAR